MEIKAAHLEANNAPLLDILFNLLIFFIMACESSVQEYVRLNTPVVREAATVEPTRDALLFNLIPERVDPEQVAAWRIKDTDYNPRNPEQYAAIKPVLVESFRSALARGRQPQVVLRADANTRYDVIHEAMAIVSESFIEAGATDPRINLSVSQR